jgi:fumarylacetoacetate (FAA) hydrolase family protein
LAGGWSHSRLRDAMPMGPVIQVFRTDRLPDDVGRALLGVIVFEEDGLQMAGVRAIVREFGLT